MTHAIWSLKLPSDLSRWFENPTNMRAPSTATTTFRQLEGGRVRVTIVHEVLRNITPAMVEWWFGHFANLVVLADSGASYPAFRLWHPTDHIDFAVKRYSLSGQLGFAKGAKVELHEVWGGRLQHLRARVRQTSIAGIHVDYCWGPITVARLSERFRRVSNGTAYTSTMDSGVSMRLVGPALNCATRMRRTEYLLPWIRHCVEEIGNLERILPGVFASLGPMSVDRSHIAATPAIARQS